MDIFIPLPIAYMLTWAFLILLGAILFLNIFSLPANWIILALVGLWKYAYPETTSMNWIFFAILIGLALLGEALEFALQMLKAKKYGSSSTGTVAGMIGAIVGAIMFAPLFFGLGALFGALLGAFVGSYVAEMLKRRPHQEAVQAAFGSMMGRFLGTICKCGIGGVMLAIISRSVWPEVAEPVQQVFNIYTTLFG